MTKPAKQKNSEKLRCLDEVYLHKDMRMYSYIRNMVLEFWQHARIY